MKASTPLVPALLLMIATLLGALVVVRAAFALDSDATRFEAETMSETSSRIYVVNDNGTQALRFVDTPASASKSISFSTNAQMAKIRVRGVDISGTTRTLPSVRVTVDGAQVLSQRVSGSYTTLTAPTSVGAGPHTVSVNMTNRDEGDRIFVDWIAFTYSEPPPPPSQCPAGEYLATYRNEASGQFGTTRPVLTRCEASPLAGEYVSPAPGVNADNFTAVWKGDFNFEAADYEFTARADDGIRVYIDGERILDEWRDQGAADFRVTRKLSAGSHTVTVQYYEAAGGAVANVSWQRSSPPPVDTGGFVAGQGSASVNRQAFVNLSNSCRNVTLTPGTYYVNNDPSLGHIHVSNYCGTFTMQEGAAIRYTHQFGSGVRFVGGTGARLLNWESHHPVPSRTQPADNLSLYNTTDFLIDDATIHGGLAGILIWESTRPTIRDTYVEHTKADGMHVVATTDARVYNYRSYWTGDDGLSFLLYGGNLNKYGAIADGVTVEQSAARGITVIGSRDATIRNFTVRNTWTAGVQVACEPNYNDCSRAVQNVTFEHGQVFNAGRSSVRGDGSVGPNPDSIFAHNVNQNIVMNDIISWSPVRNCYGTADSGVATLINVRGDGVGC